MSSIVFDPKGFLALEEEGADFINYVLEKTNDPFTFSKQADFEPMLDMLEKYLKIKGKANADLQLLLYKVQKAKKLLNKLHECLNDIEKNKNKETEQALINAICGEVSLDELEQLYEAKLPSGDYAFEDCYSLTSVVIPDSVTSIGSCAFYNCDSLTRVYYKGTASEWQSIDIDFSNSDLTDATRYYYLETEPTTSGNYWHYDENGEIAVW